MAIASVLPVFLFYFILLQVKTQKKKKKITRNKLKKEEIDKQINE